MWAQVINAALGIWLMAAPAILGYDAPAETNDRIVGPVIATFAIIACWQVLRGLRLVNLPIGLWLIIAPWVLGYDGSVLILHSMVVGAAIAGLSLVRGKRDIPYGGGWSMLFRSQPPAHTSPQSGGES